MTVGFDASKCYQCKASRPADDGGGGGLCKKCLGQLRAAPWKTYGYFPTKGEARREKDRALRGKSGHAYLAKIVPTKRKGYILKYKQKW